MMEMFYICAVQYGCYQLRGILKSKELEFLFNSILINLK